MPLAAGQTLGSYEILSPLGAGGMGEVYRARDTRLDRSVAIKVLPAHLSESAERRQRFEQEARAISQLSHPHICALYDVGSQEGTSFLVMELLEGESLAERLARGPLGLGEALACAVQICGALDVAHTRGIVHRDLKPGNIVLTRSGAKLLDFGLAKVARPGVSEGLSSLATEEKPLTAEGVVLGTFQYMAPEQLEGREADARTDLFALGAVLYEMVTGRTAFTGQSQASLIAAILTSEPPAPSALQAVAPPRLDAVVSRCLAKDPEKRWRSAADLAWELEHLGGAASAPLARTARRGVLPLAVAATLGAVLALALRPPPGDPPGRPVRSAILAPESSVRAFEEGVALSPDGRRLAFVSVDEEGRQSLWIRDLEAVDPRRLEGTEGAQNPFWSPDGDEIAFFSQRKLKRIGAAGGPVRTVCTASTRTTPRGTWNRAGVILFTSTELGPIFRVHEDGETPTPLTEVDAERGETHLWPSFLPDGEHFLFKSFAMAAGSAALYVTSLDRPSDHRLVMSAEPNVTGAFYVEPGVVVYSREWALFAQSIDPGSFTTRGRAVPIAPLVSAPGGSLLASASDEGTVAYGEPSAGRSRLVWRGRDGRVLGQMGPDGGYWTFSLSHDGGRVAAHPTDPPGLHLYEVSRGTPVRLGQPTIEVRPVWSPDDRHIVYGRAGVDGLVIRDVEERGERTLAPVFADDPRTGEAGSVTYVATDWSEAHDAVVLQRTSSGLGASLDLYLWSLATGEAVPLVSTEFDESDGRISPDGQWLAYVSDESGEENVFVRPVFGEGSGVRVSASGGREPRWRADGRELFFQHRGGRVMAAAVGPGDRIDVGDPVELFRYPTPAIPGMEQFAVTADGERFLVLERIGDPLPLMLIQNWAPEE